MSDHEAKSRSIKELKAKKHHEKLSLLRASVKEIVHREKMEPQFVILFGSYARGDFNGFSDVDLIVVDHNRDQADRLACSIQEQGLADDVLTLNSEEWNQKKKSDSFFWKSILQESSRIPSIHFWILQLWAKPCVQNDSSSESVIFRT